MTVTVTRPRSSGLLRLRLSLLLRLTGLTFRRYRLATAAACGAFGLAALALFTGALYVSQWRGQERSGVPAGRVELVAFLRDDLPAAARDGLRGVLGQLPGVAGVRLLGSDEALVRMRSELGERATVLDGVEEGFLPATLEVSLQEGPDGVGRADAIAWRLRRMEGITEVDVLRATEDQRLAEALGSGRRLIQVGLTATLLAVVLALWLAGLALRRRRSDGRLLTELGFTRAAVSAPGAMVGLTAALVGAALAAAVGTQAARLVAAAALPGLSMAPPGGGFFGSFGIVGSFGNLGNLGWTGVLTVVMASGAVLGWWGARPARRDQEGEREGDGNGDEVEARA